MCRRALIIALLACWTVSAAAQPVGTLLDDVAEALAARLDTDLEVGGEALAELLAALAANPIDVNTATAADLAAVPALGPLLAARIVAHRTASGPFTALADLAQVTGVDADAVAGALPYLTIATPRAPLRIDVVQRYARRVERSRGYDEGRYAGDPGRLTTRLRGRRGRLSAGLTLDKDPGEAFQWAPAARTFGYDHAAGHLALREAGPLALLVVGDFTAEAGQGLLFGGSGSFGKGGGAVHAPARSGRGVVPYAGAGEYAFFRGVAARVRLGRDGEVSAFASNRHLDAVLGPPTTLVTTGLHRTPTEQTRRRALRAATLGVTATFTRAQAQLGAAVYRTRFTHPLDPPPDAYRQYDLAGHTSSGASVYGHLALGGTFVFGEAGWTAGGALGAVGGLRLALSGGDVLLLARRYSPRFTAVYGSAFGERSGMPRNENGLYLGLRLPLGAHWKLETYADGYRFPWLRFGVGRPSVGWDGLLRLTYTPRRWLRVAVQARHETREEGATVSALPHRALPAVTMGTRRALRLDAAYVFGPRLELRARLESTRTNPGAPEGAPSSRGQGLLLMHDVRFRPHTRIRLDVRLALFDVDDHAARVYTYEHDVRYAFSVPAFSGTGARRYVLATVTLSQRLTAEIKLAATRYQDVHSVGSGLEEVAGPRRREVGAQIRWNL